MGLRGQTLTRAFLAFMGVTTLVTLSLSPVDQKSKTFFPRPINHLHPKSTPAPNAALLP
jgi:hypothetical protein